MRHVSFLSLLVFVALPVLAQPVDPGQTAQERARLQQSQGLVVPPQVQVLSPTPAQPRYDAGAAYHQQVIRQQQTGKAYTAAPKKPKSSQ